MKKKQYTKPLMLVERFELTQMLSSCGTLIGYSDSNCVLKDADASNALKSFAVVGYFLGGCKRYWDGDDNFDGVCFHAASNLMFSS